MGWASNVNTASYAPVHPSQTRARWRLSSSPHPAGHLRQWSAVFFALSRRNCTRSLNVCSLLLIACPRSRLPLEFHLVTRVNLSTNSTVPRKSKLRCPLLLKILECSRFAPFLPYPRLNVAESQHGNHDSKLRFHQWAHFAPAFLCKDRFYTYRPVFQLWLTARYIWVNFHAPQRRTSSALAAAVVSRSRQPVVIASNAYSMSSHNSPPNIRPLQ